MESVRLLHTADLHLGTVFRDLPPQTGSQRRKDLMQTLGEITELCIQRRVSLLLIAGDLLQQDYVARPLVDFVADQFRRIPGTQIVIAPGEADYCWHGSFYPHFPWPANVHVFTNTRLTSIWLPRLNTRVWGVAWESPQPPKPDWSLFERAEQENNVVVCHGSPQRLGIPQALLGGESQVYFALGGTHKQKAYAANALAPGSPEPLSFDEPGQHGVLLGSTGAGAFQLEFVPLARRQCITLPFQVSSTEPIEAQGEKMFEMLSSLNPEANLFRLLLTGFRCQGDRELHALHQRLKGLFYCCFEDGTEPDYDLAALRRDYSQGVVAKFIATLEKQIKDAEGQKRDLLLRARSFGLDALLSREVNLW